MQIGLADFLEPIYQRSPLQRKHITAFLEKQDWLFWQRADEFAGKLLPLLNNRDLTVDYLADAYLQLCREMLSEQLRFAKEGNYRNRTSAAASAAVYDVPDKMAAYLYGLALSIFLWPNHYAIYDFFCNCLKRPADIGAYLEIGSGHGVYLTAAMERWPATAYTAVDISDTSLEITRELVASFVPGVKLQCRAGDFWEYQSAEQYDFITLGKCWNTWKIRWRPCGRAVPCCNQAACSGYRRVLIPRQLTISTCIGTLRKSTPS